MEHIRNWGFNDYALIGCIVLVFVFNLVVSGFGSRALAALRQFVP